MQATQNQTRAFRRVTITDPHAGDPEIQVALVALMKGSAKYLTTLADQGASRCTLAYIANDLATAAADPRAKDDEAWDALYNRQEAVWKRHGMEIDAQDIDPCHPDYMELLAIEEGYRRLLREWHTEELLRLGQGELAALYLGHPAIYADLVATGKYEVWGR